MSRTALMRLLARRIAQLTDEIRELEHQITAAVTSHTPRLLTRRGIGPDNAAALLIVAGDNPDRLHSEASFAALCGVSPPEASSGKTSRRRLNRGGDRQAGAGKVRLLKFAAWRGRGPRSFGERHVRFNSRGKTSLPSSLVIDQDAQCESIVDRLGANVGAN